MVSLVENGALPLVPDVVVVDPNFQLYAPLVAAARAGRLNLHLRASGAEAIKLARRLNIDAWLVSSDLDDMAGDDFVSLLEALPNRSSQHVVTMVGSPESPQNGAGTLQHPISLDAVETVLRSPTSRAPGVLAVTESIRARALLSLPIGVGAAVLAMAVLMMG